jgi:hypothetical protein
MIPSEYLQRHRPNLPVVEFRNGSVAEQKHVCCPINMRPNDTPIYILSHVVKRPGSQWQQSDGECSGRNVGTYIAS